MSRIYDNWERLVGATIKRLQFHQLALAPSRSPSCSSASSQSDNSSVEDSSSNLNLDLAGGAPGIEGFCIIGVATPGYTLLACGYSLNGTCLALFQWVRHHPDGSREYVEGATCADYLVTANDVNTLLSVESIPMNDQGQQGDLHRVFANNNSKIECGQEMEESIKDHLSKGVATFEVHILIEEWEPATLVLMRSGLEVKFETKRDLIISEDYSTHVSIRLSPGPSTQFILNCTDGSQYPFNSTSSWMRDIMVLTLRAFQNKALKRKTGAWLCM